MVNRVFPSLCSYLDKITQQLSRESALLPFILTFITAHPRVWSAYVCIQVRTCEAGGQPWKPPSIHHALTY